MYVIQAVHCTQGNMNIGVARDMKEARKRAAEFKATGQFKTVRWVRDWHIEIGRTTKKDQRTVNLNKFVNSHIH